VGFNFLKGGTAIPALYWRRPDSGYSQRVAPGYQKILDPPFHRHGGQLRGEPQHRLKAML